MIVHGCTFLTASYRRMVTASYSSSIIENAGGRVSSHPRVRSPLLEIMTLSLTAITGIISSHIRLFTDVSIGP